MSHIISQGNISQSVLIIPDISNSSVNMLLQLKLHRQWLDQLLTLWLQVSQLPILHAVTSGGGEKFCSFNLRIKLSKLSDRAQSYKEMKKKMQLSE